MAVQTSEFWSERISTQFFSLGDLNYTNSSDPNENYINQSISDDDNQLIIENLDAPTNSQKTLENIDNPINTDYNTTPDRVHDFSPSNEALQMVARDERRSFMNETYPNLEYYQATYPVSDPGLEQNYNANNWGRSDSVSPHEEHFIPPENPTPLFTHTKPIRIRAKQRKSVSVDTQKKRRLAANARERRRMNGLNDAFDKLRDVVPAFGHDRKLSKYETLQTAQHYISAMIDLIKQADSVKNQKEY